MYLSLALFNIQEIYSQEGLKLLYKPENLQQFKYVINSSETRQISAEITLKMTFIQNSILNISEMLETVVYTEEIYQINILCCDLVDSRPHVCFQTNGITSTVRVLLQSTPVTAFKILQEYQSIKLLIDYNITKNSIQTHNTYEIIQNQLFTEIEGVKIYFATQNQQKYRLQYVIIEDDLQNAFYYPYFNISSSCNQFPTSIINWKQKVEADQNSELNTYVSVPNPYGQCHDQLPSDFVLNKYRSDKLFQSNIVIENNTVIIPLETEFPTIQLEFTSELLQYQNYSAVTQYYLRVINNFHLQSKLMKVSAFNIQQTVANRIEIDCGQKFVINSMFYEANTTYTFYFNLEQIPLICQIDGNVLPFDKQEIFWLPETIYESYCDAEYHFLLINNSCFSGCANDSLYDAIEVSCYNDCLLFGQAKPIFYATENRCVTVAESTLYNILLKPSQSLIQSQYQTLTIKCENGIENSNHNPEQIPCLCKEGFSQIKKIGQTIQMCLKNENFPISIESHNGVEQILGDIGGMVQQTFDEIGTALKQAISKIFGNQWKIWIIISIVIMGSVILAISLIKLAFFLKQQKMKRKMMMVQ